MMMMFVLLSVLSWYGVVIVKLFVVVSGLCLVE